MASKRSLEAAAATAGLFTQAQASEDKPKAKRGRPPKAKTPTPTAKAEKVDKAAGDTEYKRELVTFSAKIDSKVSKYWRTYTTVGKYGDMGRLTEAALTEYMNRHKLPPEQQKKFDLFTSID